MRIHTHSHGTIQLAAMDAGVDLVKCEEHGSRKSTRAFEIKLEGASKRRSNGGSSGAGSGYAATWDQWGVFLAAIFAVDPDASCWAYKNSADFDYQTGMRFENGWPKDSHGDHTWRFAGVPREQACTKCSAVRRFA